MNNKAQNVALTAEEFDALVKRAVNLASLLPTEYIGLAFREILDHLIANEHLVFRDVRIGVDFVDEYPAGESK